jgi:predicted enzyme related to lactoylglutathione lyase
MLTTNFVPGAPNWLDLGTPDLDRTVAFYSGLFGWTHLSLGPEAGGYGFFQLNGKTVAAVGPLMEEGQSPAWTLFFQTPDADLTTKTVEQAGGTVRVPPMEVFTAGRLAQYTDPAGGQFAVWEPKDTKGLDVVTEPGSLCWTELHTTDAAAVRSFYRAVFAWDAQDMPIPGGLTYTVVSTTNGGQEASIGGIMQLGEEQLAAGTTSHWLPYIEVTDVDAVVAKAAETGGTVRMPAVDMEGVGRMAALTDPSGAAFSVIKSQPAAGA